MFSLVAAPGWTGFNPLSLFADGTYAGFIFDQLDPAQSWTPPGSVLVYKDNGTTPVSASGDTVQLFKDRSGNGYDASQATAANRPQWTSAAVPYLLFDGSNDSLGTSLAPASDTTIAYCGLAPSPSGLNVAMGSRDGAATRCFIGLDTSHRLCAGWCSHAQSTILISGDMTNIAHVGLLRANGSTEELWKDGALGYSGTPGGSQTTTHGIAVGSFNDNGTPASRWPGRLYRAVAIRRFVPDAAVVPLMRWLGAGVVSI